METEAWELTARSAGDAGRLNRSRRWRCWVNEMDKKMDSIKQRFWSFKKAPTPSIPALMPAGAFLLEGPRPPGEGEIANVFREVRGLRRLQVLVPSTMWRREIPFNYLNDPAETKNTQGCSADNCWTHVPRRSLDATGRGLWQPGVSHFVCGQMTARFQGFQD